MGNPIDKITLKGFKSIQNLEDFELRNLNVLIGANGAGKSNFIDFFRMLRGMADEAFQQFVLAAGGGDGFLFQGPKVTREISSRIVFGPNAYEFTLTPTADGTLQIANESSEYTLKDAKKALGSGLKESNLKKYKDDQSYFSQGNPSFTQYVYRSVSSWTVYHFHDTSALAPMRRDQSAKDTERFNPDASNLAAFLAAIQVNKPKTYRLILESIRLIAPYLDDFLFRPQIKGSNEQIRLEWNQKGSDFPYQPNQLSDGTIRFICLATALLQPDPPSTIIIDEPELGLHPHALAILAGMIQSAATRTQVIISTQSPTLLDYFDPEDIVVVNREKGASTFQRLDCKSLEAWREEYSIGELWQKNVFSGGPKHE